jgi:hypothetical protein
LEIQRRILSFITKTNWVLFSAGSAVGFALATTEFALGIVFGGLLVTANFHLLHRTLKKSLQPPYPASVGSILAKYYIRFVLSGIIIFLLISQKIVNPLGLFVGLSVVVASILLATVCEVHKLIFQKEAA